MHPNSRPIENKEKPEQRSIRDIGVRTYLNNEEHQMLQSFGDTLGLTESGAVRALVLSGLEAWHKQMREEALTTGVGVALEKLALAERKAG